MTTWDAATGKEAAWMLLEIQCIDNHATPLPLTAAGGRVFNQT
jgi:hypothetical protein